MGVVKISGSSDDLVIVEDLPGGDDELSPRDTDDFLVVASDGTALRGRYDDDGVWRFSTHTAGSAAMSKVEAPVGDDDNYSDVVTLTGDIRWVAITDKLAS